jgi:F420-dependent oxidoreductase-like protein
MMVAVSISVEGINGLTWPRWKRLVTAVEQFGFARLFCSDHFTQPEPPDMDSLEMVVSLTYLADRTRHVHFGPLVAPLSFRDPVMLARQAAALDDLSGGRMILGVGAGWMEREHTMFGYQLGDVPTRMARLEEGLEVITRLLRSDEPVSYEGRFYQLHGATLLPRPQRPGGPPILVGGHGPRRTLPLVARYADIWNGAWLPPETFRERSAALDDLLRAVGRQPSDIRRTIMASIFCGRDTVELEQRLGWLRRWAEFAPQPLDALIEASRTYFKAIVGPPDTVIERIRAYAAAGAEEFVFQWWDMDDIEGLEVLAQEVMPHVVA